MVNIIVSAVSIVKFYNNQACKINHQAKNLNFKSNGAGILLFWYWKGEVRVTGLWGSFLAERMDSCIVYNMYYVVCMGDTAARRALRSGCQGARAILERFENVRIIAEDTYFLPLLGSSFYFN